MKYPTLLYTVALIFVPSAYAGDVDDLCCLCIGCKSPLSNRLNFYVDTRGKTCNALFLEMADPTNGSRAGNAECNSLIGQHRSACCESSYNPLTIAQAPTPSPGSKYGSGPNPACNLCHSGKYPEKPTTMTAILGISGNPTCRDLYWMGKEGHISDQLCNPMQDYMDVPCGCWDRAPRPSSSYTSSSSGASFGGGAPPASTTFGGNTGDELPGKKNIPEEESKETVDHGNNRGTLNRRKRALKGSR